MKVRSYKKQIEEVEEIAALNLAKFRQTQGNLGEAEQRADLSEQALAKIKAQDRAASIGPMVGNHILLRSTMGNTGKRFIISRLFLFRIIASWFPKSSH